jgi:hypothetical protein
MTNIHDYNQIINNLYVGNKNSIKYGNSFSLIVNCTNDIPFPENYSNEKIRISVKDDPSESESMFRQIHETRVLEKIHSFLQQGKPVLIHCFAGVQRSCAVLACYLMKYYVISPTSVITFIQERRPIAFFGNCNFKDTLQWFYQSIKR